jgi:hypothetical protein
MCNTAAHLNKRPPKNLDYLSSLAESDNLISCPAAKTDIQATRGVLCILHLGIEVGYKLGICVLLATIYSSVPLKRYF